MFGDELKKFLPDSDENGDSIPAVNDNYLTMANADQADTDSDGLGDVCDNKPPMAKRKDSEVALSLSGGGTISFSDID